MRIAQQYKKDLILYNGVVDDVILKTQVVQLHIFLENRFSSVSFQRNKFNYGMQVYVSNIFYNTLEYVKRTILKVQCFRKRIISFEPRLSLSRKKRHLYSDKLAKKWSKIVFFFVDRNYNSKINLFELFRDKRVNDKFCNFEHVLIIVSIV